MGTSIKVTVPVLAGILVLGSLTNAHALDFLVRPFDTVDGKFLTAAFDPHIDNNGDLLVFAGVFSGQQGIFTPDRLLVANDDTIDGKTLTAFGGGFFSSANDHGDVVFHGHFSGGQGIFSPDSLLVANGDTIGGRTLTSFHGPIVNDSGDIVYFATFSGGHGIFSPDSLLVATGDTIDGKTLTFSLSPTINDNNDLVFRGLFSGGQGIFSPDCLLVATGDTIDGKTLTGVSNPSINNNGDLVYSATFSGGQGIFSLDSLLVAAGDTIGGKTLTGATSPRINDRGDLLFIGVFDGGNGLFTIDNLLIATGNFLDGETITSFRGHQINDKGDIAFGAFTSSGIAILFEAGLQSPVDASQDLINEMNNLEGVPNGVKTSLTAPLNQLIPLLEDGAQQNDVAVCGKLSALLNQIDAKEASGKLSSLQADLLRHSSQVIIDDFCDELALNIPPSIGSVTLSPTNPVEGRTITCTANDVADSDGDVVSLAYSWTQVGGKVLSTERILPFGVSQIGPITCEVTPFDGTDFGDTVSQTVTVIEDKGGGI